LRGAQGCVECGFTKRAHFAKHALVAKLSNHRLFYRCQDALDKRITLALALRNPAEIAKQGELHLVIKSNGVEQRWIAHYDALILSPLPVGVRASIATPGDVPPLGLKPEAILQGVTFERPG